MTKHLPTQYQSFIHTSRYARWLPDENRRETWEETVARYFNYFETSLHDKQKYTLSNALRKELETAVLNLEVMPSMRCLMTAGPALERDNIAGYNCSYLPIDHPRSFDEALYTLMNGVGVGFSVETNNVDKLPIVNEHFEKTSTSIVVEDSKGGWARGLRELIAMLYAGQIPSWDLSKLRPAGAPLKTFGGRSSGPKPLDDLFKFCVGKFTGAAGRRLTPLECHDIVCKVGDVVVVGGVRRSALISLSNLNDSDMQDAKSGRWWEFEGQRALANNSAVYTRKPDPTVFLDEFTALVKSQSGERGIVNRQAADKQAAKNGRRKVDKNWGTNPCLHPDSMIETIHGRVRIADITEPTMVYSMDKEGKLCIRPCSASWVSKKNAETIKIKIASGKEVICTPDHKIYIEGKGWVEAKGIAIGDRVVHLVRNRRGAAYSGVKLSSQDKRDFVMEHRLVFEAVYGPIPKDYDINHIDENTYNNDVDNLECLSHSEHATLTRFSCANDHMKTGENPKNPSGHGFISYPESRHGAKTIITMPHELKSNLHQYASVVEISEGPITDVYDLTVEDTHNFVADFVIVHNCSEIILRPYQFCNLSEVVVRAEDTFETIARKVQLATILGTFQSTLTDFKYLRKIWKDNTEEERLLGVSLTGIYDRELFSPSELNSLRQVAVEQNKATAEALNIPISAAITCVKPSGTVSQLVDAASGIHPRHSAYYIRTVRGDKKDPLTAFMIAKGFPVEDCVMKPHDTVVFSFPQKAPEDATIRYDLTAIDHLNDWLKYQTSWCEHKPSVTITVKNDEWLDVAAWVYKHFDEVSGISFLPYADHTYKQAPYQDCTKEQYEELLAKMPQDINWAELAEYEKEDATVATQTLACSSGVCEI